MPLPVLKIPKYRLTIPSTKEKIQYRPFLVKEEKILMIAQESENEVDILDAIKDILIACTFDKFDPSKNTTYDMEYIFLQLRSKSVGENIKLHFPCKECSTKKEITINLNDVKIKFPKTTPDNNIKLSEGVGLTLKQVSMDEAIALHENTSLLGSIQAVIDTVYDSENVYSLGNFTEKEVEEFIDSFSHSALEKVEEYISGQPSLEHKIKFKCPKCEKENEETLSGLEAFF